MRDWISKRRVKRMAERVAIPANYQFDQDNAKCVQGGHWDYPNGIAQDSAQERRQWAS